MLRVSLAVIEADCPTREVGGVMRLVSFSGRRGRLAVLLLAVVAVAGGGVAYANIPDSGGAIHGCYKKTSPNQGTLRLIDTEKDQTCQHNETSVDWNQAGQPGEPGQPGQRGPSDGWDAGLFGTVPTGGRDVRLSGGATGLTPGSYLLSGEATWPALDSGSAYLFCNIVAAATDASGSTTGGFGIASMAGGGSVAMMGAMTVNSGTGSLWVECRENSGTVSVPVLGRVHAIQVATLH